MVQQISIDPDLWARTRRRAFDTHTTASKIVAAALAEYLDRADKLQAEMAAKRATPSTQKVHDYTESLVPQAVVPVIEQELRAGIGGEVVKSHQEGDVRVIDEVRLMEVSVTADRMPWDGPVIVKDALPPPAVIKDPKDAAAAVAALKESQLAGREFHPVPKPVRKPRTKR